MAAALSPAQREPPPSAPRPPGGHDRRDPPGRHRPPLPLRPTGSGTPTGSPTSRTHPVPNIGRSKTSGHRVVVHCTRSTDGRFTSSRLVPGRPTTGPARSAPQVRSPAGRRCAGRTPASTRPSGGSASGPPASPASGACTPAVEASRRPRSVRDVPQPGGRPRPGAPTRALPPNACLCRALGSRESDKTRKTKPAPARCRSRFRGVSSGLYWIRTSDLVDVNDAL